MANRPSFVHDGLRSLIDSIEMQRDPAVRLAAYLYLDEMYKEVAHPGRDRAAYDARKQYAIADISAVAGCQRHEIHYWISRHIERTGAPPVGRRHRVDMSNVIDLTDRLGILRTE